MSSEYYFTTNESSLFTTTDELSENQDEGGGDQNKGVEDQDKESANQNDRNEDNEKICRYCYEEVKEDPKDYVNPCTCITPVHTKCINTWLAERGRERCEICRHQFAFTNIEVKWKDCLKACCQDFCSSLIKKYLPYFVGLIPMMLAAGGYSWYEYFNGTYKYDMGWLVGLILAYYVFIPLVYPWCYYLTVKSNGYRFTNNKTMYHIIYHLSWLLFIIISHAIGIAVEDKYKTFRPRDLTYAVGAVIINWIVLGILILIFLICITWRAILCCCDECQENCKRYTNTQRVITDLEQV